MKKNFWTWLKSLGPSRPSCPECGGHNLFKQSGIMDWYWWVCRDCSARKKRDRLVKKWTAREAG